MSSSAINQTLQRFCGLGAELQSHIGHDMRFASTLHLMSHQMRTDLGCTLCHAPLLTACDGYYDCHTCMQSLCIACAGHEKGDGLDQIGSRSVRHLKTLGAGSFGQVELVEFTDTGALGAMKKSDHSNAAMWENEVRCTTRVHDFHKGTREGKGTNGADFVVKALHAGRERTCDVVVLEYCSGGDLFGKFSAMDETHARFYLANLVRAVEQTHAAGVIHRDIKPENILVDHTGYLKLTDFGLSVDTTSHHATSPQAGGTHGYMPPEVYVCGHFSKAMDLYAVGAVFYELLTGKPMLRGSPEEIAKRVCSTNIPDLHGKVSDEASHLFDWLVDPTYGERAGSNGVQEIKAHKFFAGFDWEKLERRQYKAPWVPM